MILAEIDFSTVAAGTGIGALVTGLITYFTVTSKAKKFVRDSMGRNEEFDVRVKQPLEVKGVVVYAEKDATENRFALVEAQIGGVQRHFDQKFEEARKETDEKLDAIESRTGHKLDEMAKDAVVGRRILHDKVDDVRQETVDKVDELRKDMAAIPAETINLLLKTKELNK